MNNKTTYSSSYSESINIGLRNYMIKVYNYMGLGILLTALTAYTVANNIALFTFVQKTSILWIIGSFGLVMAISAGINRMQASTIQTLFWAYSVVVGMLISSIFVVYEPTSIIRTFFVSSSIFLGMSLYGYTTKRSLSNMGAYLFMALFGIIIASIVNIFTQSSLMHFLISIAGVIIFTLLTAYDTQKIKNIYMENDNEEVNQKKAIVGALTLYLDLLNLFLFLLRFMGSRR